jgi:anti-sigma-K factor RskA
VNGVDLHHLAAAYALDALDVDERLAFEAHLATCDVCRADIGEYRATAASLATVTATPPPPSLKSAVMAEIATTRQIPPRTDRRRVTRSTPRRTVWTAMLAAAAAVIVFVAGAVVATLVEGPSFADEAAEVLTAPDVAVVDLAGDGDGSVRVAFAGERAVVIADDLPSVPAGRAYELWVIDAGGAAIPVHLLDHADGGSVRRVVDLDGVPVAFGVTVEDDGGSPTPTEPILFVGEVTIA